MVRELLKDMNRIMAIKEGIIEEGEKEIPYDMIDERLRDPETFALRIPNCNEHEELCDGVSLDSTTIELGDGHFTNLYDYSFRSDDEKFEMYVMTLKRPRYPHRILKNGKHQEIEACINGAFFFLHDGSNERDPKEIAFNLNIRDGHIIGLPATDRPALFVTKDGVIHGQELRAHGTMQIGQERMEWVGGEPFIHKKDGVPLRPYDYEKEGVVLFNSACCTIAYEDPKDKKSLRKVQYDLNTTPKRQNATDIGVSPDENGILRVSSITPGGGTDFFSANFILQIPNEKMGRIALGDTVNPEILDNLSLRDIQSAATVAPLVHHFLRHTDHPVNYDASLGTFPPFAPNARYARSIMYEDAQGRTHMAVFDAVPGSKYMSGVTPREAAEHIPADARWAVFLDGGQSSRITFRDKQGEVHSRGNRQYVRLSKIEKTSQRASKGQRYLWSNRGRPLPVNIVLKRRQKNKE